MQKLNEFSVAFVEACENLTTTTAYQNSPGAVN